MNVEQGVVDKKFCINCNREVPSDEILVRQVTIIKDGKVSGIRDKLIHEKCGGTIVSSQKLSELKKMGESDHVVIIVSKYE